MSQPEDNLEEHRGQPLDRAFDPDVFRQLFQNQAQEIEVRREENELKRQELDLSYAQAQRVLEAQAADRQQERQHIDKAGARAFIISILFLVLLAAGIGYALYLDKDQLVLDLAKNIGLLFAGGLGGYGLRTINEKKDTKK